MATGIRVHGRCCVCSSLPSAHSDESKGSRRLSVCLLLLLLRRLTLVSHSSSPPPERPPSRPVRRVRLSGRFEWADGAAVAAASATSQWSVNSSQAEQRSETQTTRCSCPKHKNAFIDSWNKQITTYTLQPLIGQQHELNGDETRKTNIEHQQSGFN